MQRSQRVLMPSTTSLLRRWPGRRHWNHETDRRIQPATRRSWSFQWSFQSHRSDGCILVTTDKSPELLDIVVFWWANYWRSFLGVGRSVKTIACLARFHPLRVVGNFCHYDYCRNDCDKNRYRHAECRQGPSFRWLQLWLVASPLNDG